jgi:hypothetical protein
MSYGQVCASIVLSTLGLLIVVASIGALIFLIKEIVKLIKA